MVAVAEKYVPVVLEDLSEEECFLYCLLQDQSGIDQASLLWVDEESKDGCWRPYDFQFSWWRCESPLQIDHCARSVGKSTSIVARGCAFPLVHPGQEMVITAPEFIHLDPITSLVEHRLQDVRLYREMLGGVHTAITHRPFKCMFLNGARIIGRIPQRTGKGLKGTHPLWLEMDEASDFEHSGWVEITETLKRGSPGATWRAHGVTRGIRDDFYERTQAGPNNPFVVHQYCAMWRPTWNDVERQEKIQQYGSTDDPGYKRNILGQHGDASAALFVLTRLMACVDSNEASDYNADEYYCSRIKAETIAAYGEDLEDYLQFPERHKKYLGTTKMPKAWFWVGVDLGFTVDPSEVLVFVEYRKRPSDEVTKFRLLTRLHLERVGYSDQVSILLRVINFYRPRVLAVDKTGLGLPLFMDLQERCAAQPELQYALDVVKGYGFAEKLIVELDGTIELNDFDDADEAARKAGIKRSVLEHSSDLLRGMVDDRRLELPWDAEVLKSFQGSTWTQVRGTDQYGRRKFTGDNTHCLDSSRLAVLAHAQYKIEAILAKREIEPVLDRFLT